MPSYVCTTTAGQLSTAQKARIAAAITHVHHDVTGAPAYLARVQFAEAAAGDLFIGGARVDHDHLFVLGYIRSGRTSATRSALVRGLGAAVQQAGRLHHRGVWVYLVELPPHSMAEFGYLLPEPGVEQAWADALSDGDRAWIQSLDSPHEEPP